MTRLVVAADLDGTLCFGGRPPGRAIRALLLSLTQRSDVRVVIATARPPRAVKDVLGTLTDRVDLISCNGALVVTSAGAVHRTVLPSDLVRRIVDELRADDAEFCLHRGDDLVASSATALAWMAECDRQIAGSHVPTEGVLKICVADAERWLPRLRELTHGRAELNPHAINGDVDVVTRGVDKATALDRLLGPDRPRIVALGNDLNDATLLAAADVAIVVGGGLPDMDWMPHVRRVRSHGGSVGAALRAAVA